MKFFLVTVFIFLGACEITAQLRMVPPRYGYRDISKMSTIDSTKIRVWYAMNAQDIKDFDTFTDLFRMEIGSHTSTFYSYYLFHSDSLCTVWDKKNRNAGAASSKCSNLAKYIGDLDWHEFYFTFIYKDILSDKLTAYTLTPLFVPHFWYTDDPIVHDWTLHDESTTIAGYLCQKAVCSFRGRDFEAWFAPDIPISNGPWKFGGLPGLILKIYDTDRLFVFECAKIETFQKAYPVKKHEFSGFVETDRIKFRNLMKEMYKDFKKVSAGWDGFGKLEQNQFYDLWELE